LRVIKVVSAPFDENAYVAYLEGRTDCLVIDPSFEADKIIEELVSRSLSPAAILNTHGHADHIAGNRAMKKRWPACPLVIGEADAPKLSDARLNLSANYGIALTSPPADVLLKGGSRYQAAGFDLRVEEIPGHSRGHVVFIDEASRPCHVFGGDVLFAGSVGRTDFPDGSFEQLAAGIHSKLFDLPDDTIILPGHGPSTTIGEEKENNPFVGRAAGWRG
jgi:glyoxylase-like metal-dependent hydrolase (beta-lactamase superfamily II)